MAEAAAAGAVTIAARTATCHETARPQRSRAPAAARVAATGPATAAATTAISQGIARTHLDDKAAEAAAEATAYATTVINRVTCRAIAPRPKRTVARTAAEGAVTTAAKADTYQGNAPHQGGAAAEAPAAPVAEEAGTATTAANMVICRGNAHKCARNDVEAITNIKT